jgi:hypothetical protein
MTMATDDPEGRARITAFLQMLQQSGWTDGHNVQIDTRWARQCQRHSQIRRRIGWAIAGGHPREWQCGGSAAAAGDPRRADCVRDRPRSGRRWLRRRWSGRSHDDTPGTSPTTLSEEAASPLPYRPSAKPCDHARVSLLKTRSVRIWPKSRSRRSSYRSPNANGLRCPVANLPTGIIVKSQTHGSRPDI